jgi:hypothetical protein
MPLMPMSTYSANFIAAALGILPQLARLHCGIWPVVGRAHPRIDSDSHAFPFCISAMNVRTNRLGLPFYFASAIQLARILYEPRRQFCWRCAGLSVHLRPCARLESRRKPQLDSQTGPYKQIALHRPSILRVRPGCRVIVWRKNFTKVECGPLGSNRLETTGSNVAQHWPHSKNRRHFRFGPRSQSGPSPVDN